tara:strand:- start:194415 stop:194972 length:558 start_codon:yes stop_codon:yes gene_type:complete
MNMKTFFTFFIVLFSGFNLWSETDKSEGKKAILSYALPSKLNWKQASGEDLPSGMQVFDLDETQDLRLASVQVGNEFLWEKVANADKDKIFDELIGGKKTVHKISGVKNWKAEKKLNRKSDKEIILELVGSFTEDSQKKHFIEKYYMTPYGFILMTLDWTEKSDAALVKKARAEFENVTFKSEIK